MGTPPDQPPSGPLSAARTAALAASLVLLLAVVSLAARSGDHDRPVPGASTAVTTGHHAVVWVLLVLGPIAAVLGLGIFLYAQVMRRRDEQQMLARRRRSRIRRAVLLLAFTILVVYSWLTDQNPAEVLIGLLRDIFGGAHLRGLLPSTGHEPAGQRHHVQGHGDGVSGVDWAIAGLTWLLLVAGAVVAFRRMRHSPAAAPAAATPREQEPADLGLARLRGDADPRRAVIGAYALMDRVMTERSLGRRRSEAPLEYLGRMTAAGYERITALGRLTRLYARARFSTHPIDRRMQAEAVDAVEAIATEGGE